MTDESKDRRQYMANHMVFGYSVMVTTGLKSISRREIRQK